MKSEHTVCGIAGIVNLTDVNEPPSIELLRSMISTLRHRGPDEFGVYRDEYAGLVHARLSIIDLSMGQQPMTNERETLWIVFNGEIFNFVELRTELAARGHHFRTRSDTEVILNAYQEWGTDCFSRFNGQWALAIWDTTERRLILSRDRVGVRPLYMYRKNGRLLFASEVKAIFSDLSVTRAFDVRGFEQTFTYWGPIAPTSVFSGVEELRPGIVRVYENDGSYEDTIYWEPTFPIADTTPGTRSNHVRMEDAAQELYRRLMKATELRMVRSDVPVGSYLSGGIDSSLVAWMGRQAASGEFRTFSIRFTDAEFDETEYQRLMTSMLDSSHEECLVSRRDIAAVFPEVVFHTERPVLRTAPAPLFILSRLVRNGGIKAVLTGEGADEMLAGYDLFREAKIRAFIARQPESSVRPKLFARLYPYLARSPQQAKGLAVEFWKRGLDRVGQPGFSHEPRWFTTSTLQRFFSAGTLEEMRRDPMPSILSQLPLNFGSWDLLAQAQYLEIITLFSSYIISSQGDRMLMAHSVEGRFPYLDVDVIEFCNHLPAECKLIGLDEKKILKRIARGIIPDPIVQRKKQPYRAPDAVCFLMEDAPEYVDEMLSERSLTSAGIFDVKRVRNFYQKCCERLVREGGDALFSNTDNMGLIGILSTQLLFHQFVRNYAVPADNAVNFTTYVDRVGVYSN